MWEHIHKMLGIQPETSLLKSNKHVVRHEYSREKKNIYINNVEGKLLYKTLGDALL